MAGRVAGAAGNVASAVAKPRKSDRQAVWCEMTEMPFRQREYMRQLATKHGGDKKKVCAAYAKAERDRLLKRSRDENDLSPEAHADVLWRDAQRWGWLNS